MLRTLSPLASATLTYAQGGMVLPISRNAAGENSRSRVLLFVPLLVFLLLLRAVPLTARFALADRHLPQFNKSSPCNDPANFGNVGFRDGGGGQPCFWCVTSRRSSDARCCSSTADARCCSHCSARCSC